MFDDSKIVYPIAQKDPPNAFSRLLDNTWNATSDAWEWLRGVLLGEWEEDKSLSQIVADAMAGFVPGVGTIITIRDLIAVIVRLAKHPEKRDDIDEWILLIAMLLPLIITVIGAAAAGVGALVGAELGAFLRAVALTLVKKGGATLKVLAEFLQAHGYGDVIKALRQIKFSKYRKEVADGLNAQIDKLIGLTKEFKKKLEKLDSDWLPDWIPGRDYLVDGIKHCETFIKQLIELRNKAKDMIPKALIEMDERLGALLAGDIKTAINGKHTVPTGQAAPKVEKLEPNTGRPENGTLKNERTPEPENTRRLGERRIVQFRVDKHRQEYRYVNDKGIPVGAKPYHEGKTTYEFPAMEEEAWKAQSKAVEEGYPDLDALDRRGRQKLSYATFHEVRKADLPPDSKAVRVIPHDGEDFKETGEFWTRELPEDGRQLRAGTAVKENWNKNGSYVELTVPPKGHPVWKELGQDPNNPTLKGWEGPAAAQRYQYTDPKTGKRIDEDMYLPGGDDQLFFDSAQLQILKKHGFISERSPTNFPDYDPTVVNPDGTLGNIVHSSNGAIFENIPKDEAVARAATNP